MCVLVIVIEGVWVGVDAKLDTDMGVWWMFLYLQVDERASVVRVFLLRYVPLTRSALAPAQKNKSKTINHGFLS